MTAVEPAKSTRSDLLGDRQVVKLDIHTMTVADLRGLTGLSPQRIHQLDAVLLPVRKGTQNERRYDPRLVKAFLASRAKR